MGERNTHKDHPLQFIRLTCGLTQPEFAAALDISWSNLTKKETSKKTSQPGSKDISSELRRRVYQEFGAVILSDRRKQPGEPGYFRPVIDIENRPFTRSSYEEHRCERIPLVKYPAADVCEAVAAVAQICTALKRENQFADALVAGLKGLCNSDRFKIALSAEIKKMIPQKPVAAAWLCTLLDDDELRRKFGKLPTLVAHQLKGAQRLKEFGVTRVLSNGKPV